MKVNPIFKLSCFALLTLLLSLACTRDVSSFGKDLQVETLPTSLSYTDILNARENSYIESSVPFINSNGHPVEYRVVHVKKDNTILDGYLEKVSIVNPDTTIVPHENEDLEGYEVVTIDISKAGKVIIEDENEFTFGDYYFAIETTVNVNNERQSVVFEDALHLNVGPGLVEGLSYCPNKLNFVSGAGTMSGEPTVIGGNPDFRFELGSEDDKLLIDETTGIISLNPSYTISAREDLKPIINVVNNYSEEVVAFEDVFTAILSTEPVEVELETNYFFYPTLKAKNNKNLGLGGAGWSRQITEGTFPGWIQKNNIWKNNPPVATQDAIDARTAAGVSGNFALFQPAWAKSMNFPWETWVIADAVNLTPYIGCFDTKVVFWTKMNLASVPNYMPDGRTPFDLDIVISDNYTGDVTTTNWTQINDLVTCEINNNGVEFVGTPYPGDQTGDDPDGVKDPTKNANNMWVRCELDLTDHLDIASFTIAFKAKTNFDAPLAEAKEGNFSISDVHFVAKEKQN